MRETRREGLPLLDHRSRLARPPPPLGLPTGVLQRLRRALSRGSRPPSRPRATVGARPQLVLAAGYGRSDARPQPAKARPVKLPAQAAVEQEPFRGLTLGRSPLKTRSQRRSGLARPVPLPTQTRQPPTMAPLVPRTTRQGRRPKLLLHSLLLA